MPHRLLALLLFLLAAADQAHALDKISFATNGRAQAEHGGFHQAVADGTYARYGLDSPIPPGFVLPLAAAGSAAGHPSQLSASSDRS